MKVKVIKTDSSSTETEEIINKFLSEAGDITIRNIKVSGAGRSYAIWIFIFYEKGNLYKTNIT